MVQIAGWFQEATGAQVVTPSGDQNRLENIMKLKEAKITEILAAKHSFSQNVHLLTKDVQTQVMERLRRMLLEAMLQQVKIFSVAKIDRASGEMESFDPFEGVFKELKEVVHNLYDALFSDFQRLDEANALPLSAITQVQKSLQELEGIISECNACRLIEWLCTQLPQVKKDLENAISETSDILKAAFTALSSIGDIVNELVEKLFECIFAKLMDGRLKTALGKIPPGFDRQLQDVVIAVETTLAEKFQNMIKTEEEKISISENLVDMIQDYLKLIENDAVKLPESYFSKGLVILDTSLKIKEHKYSEKKGSKSEPSRIFLEELEKTIGEWNSIERNTLTLTLLIHKVVSGASRLTKYSKVAHWLSSQQDQTAKKVGTALSNGIEFFDYLKVMILEAIKKHVSDSSLKFVVSQIEHFGLNVGSLYELINSQVVKFFGVLNRIIEGLTAKIREIGLQSESKSFSMAAAKELKVADSKEFSRSKEQVSDMLESTHDRFQRAEEDLVEIHENMDILRLLHWVLANLLPLVRRLQSLKKMRIELSRMGNLMSIDSMVEEVNSFKSRITETLRKKVQEWSLAEAEKLFNGLLKEIKKCGIDTNELTPFVKLKFKDSIRNLKTHLGQLESVFETFILKRVRNMPGVVSKRYRGELEQKCAAKCREIFKKAIDLVCNQLSNFLNLPSDALMRSFKYLSINPLLLGKRDEFEKVS